MVYHFQNIHPLFESVTSDEETAVFLFNESDNDSDLFDVDPIHTITSQSVIYHSNECGGS